MQKIMLSGIVALSLVAGSVAQAAPSAKKGIRVVSGAKALSNADKASVDGTCGCGGGEVPEAPRDSKPGYGFGTTGHYGPPGQGFKTDDTWREHVRGDGLTPSGRALPPRAFTTPTR